MNNTTDATCDARSAYPPCAPAISSVCMGFVTGFYVFSFMCVFCKLLFVFVVFFFLFATPLSTCFRVWVSFFVCLDFALEKIYYQQLKLHTTPTMNHTGIRLTIKTANDFILVSIIDHLTTE